MTPMVTLFQWDLPYNMQEMGGLTNPLFVNWFEQYARFVFSTFGHKVKFWMTINEPNSLCYGGYSYEFIPLLNLSGITDYLCGHHALLAHANVYHLYDREFRPSQNGKVGYNINVQLPVPLDPTSQDDINSTEDDYHWSINGLLHPIFSNAGDYPRIMKERIANYSSVQGFATSRLPSFTNEQINDIRGSADFLGLSYYTYDLIKAQVGKFVEMYDEDVGAAAPNGFQYKDAPQIFSKGIQRINNDYHPTIYITENGFPDAPLEDKAKITYLRGHLAEVLKAIKNGVDIRAYLVWSLLDTFQWQHGYRPKFGLFQVNFNDSNLIRTPRLSARYIAQVYKTRHLIDMSALNDLPSLSTTA
ncbi:Lactase-phlorizin hydrolase [Harpegnathos saltator]|uniref:Lactase-phlorizin hydrolase n=2 Tax=Harpegnathos saltator TaxID=610380 RepID=E2BBV2_HARSA|nr:Lactase-phlorizin hydrolase [Harpegnathos saltator]